MTSLNSASINATSTRHDATSQYLYAIIPVEEALIFEVEGVEPGSDVYTVQDGGLAVVTSQVPRSDFGGLDRAEAMRYLTAHQRVVDAVLREYPLLPVKFGTTLSNERRLIQLLRQSKALLREHLTQLEQKEQLEVVVLWDLNKVLAELAASPEVVAVKEQVAQLPAEQSESGRILLGQLVHGLLQQRRAGLSAHVLEHLRVAAEDVVVNPLMDETMVANLALLIDTRKRMVFDQRLDQLDQQFGGQLHIRCIDSLAPYSFATVEVAMLDFAEVVAARQVLELDEEVSAATIKQSFRRLAARTHPDYNQDDPTASSQMDALTNAYRFLTEVATSQVGSDPQALCRLSREDVEATLMVRVVRQEAVE
ncbi:GvpL/GvpF family gas vesicle protein [Candidatus Chloroploca asiatica]|uniref:J domain-containing protein n=1 Tax=Candidatus Chloroploca asiatica TaxID=1506545 RepID=A0A2H3L7H1_9CHLR|nr:GvpL/GvpF family gas vesicle protein [Candidatus Chloroploca asiatica]PDW01087.1 hypothetical protein A9Q02_07995 [Candidatus Chloroploca asiatica]